MTTPLLEIEDLNVWFELPGGGELHAVRGIGFELVAGERFGLVGESGCGKTTAMLSIMGLLPPNASVAGEVRLDGENILARGEETVSRHRWDDIAMALACSPKILLADEPTTALDVMVQAQILELLVSLAADFDLALILVTHDLPVVAQVCDRAAVMYAGEVAESATIDALFHTPKHPYTRLLFAATPDLHAGGERVASIPGAPPRLDQPIIGCPFQPRCDSAFQPCATVTPLLKQVGEHHVAACHLNDHVRAAQTA